MTIFNPQSCPIESIAGEGAIDPARLNTAWIRERFRSPAGWQAESTDEHRTFLLKDVAFKKAAVLVGLVGRDQGLQILFTQRTAHLSQHPGQISFPGGRAEQEDRDSIATALRETREEIGLDQSKVEILGTLPDYFTITGYCVTPVVASIADIGELSSDQNEVAEIFEVPLDFLMDGRHHQRRSLIMKDEAAKRTFYAMPYQNYFIWGATAGMLRNLFHFLRA
jgi:8-oxo-dGTP pyrophosphatase MutT (NUDIX family)